MKAITIEQARERVRQMKLLAEHVRKGAEEDEKAAAVAGDADVKKIFLESAAHARAAADAMDREFASMEEKLPK